MCYRTFTFYCTHSTSSSLDPNRPITPTEYRKESIFGPPLTSILPSPSWQHTQSADFTIASQRWESRDGHGLRSRVRSRVHLGCSTSTTLLGLRNCCKFAPSGSIHLSHYAKDAARSYYLEAPRRPDSTLPRSALILLNVSPAPSKGDILGVRAVLGRSYRRDMIRRSVRCTYEGFVCSYV